MGVPKEGEGCFRGVSTLCWQGAKRTSERGAEEGLQKTGRHAGSRPNSKGQRNRNLDPKEAPGVYSTVIQKVKVGCKLGKEFETHWGVKQGPLSTDLFGIMIKILYDLLRVCCPTVGIEIGKSRVPCSFFIDDLKLMAESVGELQAESSAPFVIFRFHSQYG